MDCCKHLGFYSMKNLDIKSPFENVSEWSNQLLKILLMKMFSNHSDFCFHITIHKILDKKSLYVQKNFISEKKFVKILKKPNFFQNHY